MGERVYAVHATRPEEVGSVEVIFSDEQAARAYAVSRSTDHRVLAVSVTEFVMGELGTRHPVAWYRDAFMPSSYSRGSTVRRSSASMASGSSLWARIVSSSQGIRAPPSYGDPEALRSHHVACALARSAAFGRPEQVR
jgi:hypothetical protein